MLDDRRSKVFIKPDYSVGFTFKDIHIPTDLYEAVRLSAATVTKLLELGMDPNEEIRNNREDVTDANYMNALDIVVRADKLKLSPAAKYLPKTPVTKHRERS
jgi:hypothetical protein